VSTKLITNRGIWTSRGDVIGTCRANQTMLWSLAGCESSWRTRYRRKCCCPSSLEHEFSSLGKHKPLF